MSSYLKIFKERNPNYRLTGHSKYRRYLANHNWTLGCLSCTWFNDRPLWICSSLLSSFPLVLLRLCKPCWDCCSVLLSSSSSLVVHWSSCMNQSWTFDSEIKCIGTRIGLYIAMSGSCSSVNFLWDIVRSLHRLRTTLISALFFVGTVFGSFFSFFRHFYHRGIVHWTISTILPFPIVISHENDSALFGGG